MAYIRTQKFVGMKETKSQEESKRPEAMGDEYRILSTNIMDRTRISTRIKSIFCLGFPFKKVCLSTLFIWNVLFCLANVLLWSSWARRFTLSLCFEFYFL